MNSHAINVPKMRNGELKGTKTRNNPSQVSYRHPLFITKKIRRVREQTPPQVATQPDRSKDGTKAADQAVAAA